MTRILIQYLLPLVAPSAVYVMWLLYSRYRANKVGDVAPAFTRGGFFWALLLGGVLLVASLATMAVMGGVDPDSGVYEAPRLENGEIIGPSYTPADNTGDSPGGNE